MAHSEFSVIYKTWSNQQLFHLLQNKDEYQPLAIEAAQAELNSRQLSSEDLQALEEEYQQLQLQQQVRQQKQKQFEHKLALYKEKISTELNPITIQTIDRKVRLFCYSIGIIILYNFFTSFKWITNLFKHGYWGGPTALALAPFFFVPVGIYYFWHKQKIGWSILTIWLVLSVLAVIFNYSVELLFQDSGILTRFYAKRGLMYYVTIFLFYLGLLFYINSKKIIAAFMISKRFQLQTIIITTLLTFLYFFTIIF